MPLEVLAGRSFHQRRPADRSMGSAAPYLHGCGSEPTDVSITQVRSTHSRSSGVPCQVLTVPNAGKDA